MRLIDVDTIRKPIYAEDDNITGLGMTYDEMNGYNDGVDAAWSRIDNAPTVDAVPTDFHDKCMQAEIQKRIRLEKIASLLCEGYLDMPSGCDGCPLADTMVEDDEGNGVCELSRDDNDRA